MKLAPAICLAAGVLALCLMGTGCRKLKPSSAGVVVESFPSAQIKVNSNYLRNRFQVIRYAAQKDDTGRLQTTITMRNNMGDCPLEYRYRWLDKGGIEIPSRLTIWQQTHAGGGEEVLMTGIAPTKDAEDFILDIRLFYSSTRW